MGSVALSAYLGVSWLAGPLAPILLRRRMARGKEDPERLAERLGRAGLPRPDGPLIWLHGASVGEAMSLLPLIRTMATRADAHFLVTTGTVTSAQRLANLLHARTMHQYVPVDTAAAVAGFLNHWQPDLAIWVESELWPRLVTETARRGIPMAMVNARLSAHSHARWLKARGMASALFGRFEMILAQDHDTVTRLSDFGATARFAGNLKALVDVPVPEPNELELFRAATGHRPVWLAASTHEGEEEELLSRQRAVAQNPGALLILAPRHPERAEDVVRLIRAQGLSFARRSRREMPSPDTQVYLADTLGEMGLWYALAPVTFVGGSLVPRGGHTPFEPITAGSVVLHGPHVDNFAPAYAALAEAGGAVGIAGSDALGRQLAHLLTDMDARNAVRDQAARAHGALKPDIGAISEEVLALMEPT